MAWGRASDLSNDRILIAYRPADLQMRRIQLSGGIMHESVKDVLPTQNSISVGVREIEDLRRRAVENPNLFWEPFANDLFWYEKRGPLFEQSADPPYGRWFEEWKTNLCYNAVDRWAKSPRKNKVAFFWEGEPGDRRAITYYELYREVGKMSSVLRNLGVAEGDRVTIYMPMIPELIVSLLATVRIGAIHSVVFGGFTSQALADRINDSKSKVVITADGGWRRGKVIELKKIADDAMKQCPSVQKVIVVRRTGQDVEMDSFRDLWYDELIKGAENNVKPVPVKGTHPSYILYTSGTTGKPKGAVHSTGGYMLWTYYTQKVVFDIRDEDIYWCTADIGWVTGHSYIVYGPLLNGATSFFYEGAPDFPEPDRWWRMIEEYGITILYTAPTAIRSFMKFGDKWPQKHDLSSLRLLGTVGEPINPEAWSWYYRTIGSNRCQIVDTWWQTETGGIMISPQTGTTQIPLKPGSASVPLPGVDAHVVDDSGNELPEGQKGFLVIDRPWPGQFMTLWEDKQRFDSVYFKKFPGKYYAADYAMQDQDGYFWLLGRADEVLKIAGHRIGTIELEDTLIAHPSVAESAVIGKFDEVKGESPVAFVVLRPGSNPTAAMRRELLDHVRNSMGPIAVPGALYFVERLPKTRSGKIMRRLIKAVVEEKSLGDVSTLEDSTSVEEAEKAYRELEKEIKGS